MIKTTIRDLRSTGANLNKIWGCLAALRTEISNFSASENSTNSSQSSDNESPLTFPDPSPLPLSFLLNTRSLRSLQQPTDTVNVLHSTQMIPVFLSLIHSSLLTAIIREDIDQSMKDKKDFARDAKEATKFENERWEKDRVGMDNPNKNKNKTIEVFTFRSSLRRDIFNYFTLCRIKSSERRIKYKSNISKVA